MSQYDELKRLAAEQCISSDLGMFEDHQLCENILALIAENERLHAMTRATMGVGSGEGSLFVHGDYDSIKAAQAIVIDRDQLRAENAGLKTGYQAYEQVNAELKAEVEGLRKDAERYRWLCERFGITKLPCAVERILGGDIYVADGKFGVDVAIDAAMAQGEQP